MIRMKAMEYFRLIPATRWMDIPKTASFVVIAVLTMLSSCKKLVSISNPTDRIVDNVVFSTDDLANSAMNGVYKTLLTSNSFSSGSAMLYGALSSDDLIAFFGATNQYYLMNTNHLSIIRNGPSGNGSVTDNIWSSAFGAIYAANAVIEGISASASDQLHDSVRKTLTAEAMCIRAFCYFYLTNFYDEVPLVLSTDYNSTITLPRSPRSAIYEQIVEDLKEAQTFLPADYAAGGGKRVRVNKWAATALLARVYLFTGDYENAATQATAVIDNSQYGLESDLNNVFLTTSREAIWQINQQSSVNGTDATPEGLVLLPAFVAQTDTGYLEYTITPQLLNAFDTGDLRRQAWIDSVVVFTTDITAYYSHKYKIGAYNQTIGGSPIEYYTILRLAEQYLIRAEAKANGATGGTGDAIADLNTVRNRAGLPNLPGTLTQDALLEAVAHEWQTEFFCEWGHRWFNLKRTGRASEYLSSIPLKQPWAGDYQLLYPVPPADISRAPNVTQNPGY